VSAAPTENGTRRPLVSAGSARSLLLTVLGELVLPSGEPVWTSALLYVLRGVGVEEQTARQAIARGAAAGWIEGTRRGREVRWEITPAGRQLIEEGTRRVYSLSAGAPAWDGRWLILLITIPHELRAVRKKLYGALSWAGFGNPATSVWLTPHPERVAGWVGCAVRCRIGGGRSLETSLHEPGEYPTRRPLCAERRQVDGGHLVSTG